MKNLKTKIIIFVGLILMLIINLNPISIATDASSNPKYIGITELKTESGMGYAIGNPNTGGITSTAAKLWNFIEYDSSTSNTYSENNIYCLKAGVGFQDENKRVKYDVFYDMKKEKEDIAKQNDILKDLVEKTIELENGTKISRYNAILAVLDMFYYNGISDESYKENLIKGAGIHEEAYQYGLTKDDIEAVQQAVVWYFTNYGEENGKYDKTNNSEWLNYTTDKTIYSSLSDYKEGGEERQEQAEILYKYLIKEAKEKAPEYDDIESTKVAPIQLDTQTLNYEIEGKNTIIGPIHITKNNIKAYELEFITKIDNIETNDYILLNKDKNQVSEGTTINDLIGEDFYISLPVEKTIEKTISIEVNINYNNANFIVWASSTNNQEQPVVIPEKEEISIPKKLEIEIPNLQGEYNLEIIKADQENTGKTLEGAEFKVTLADGTERTERTNAEGKIEIEGIEITEEGIDKIKIEEIEAPEGYNKIFNSVELEVTKEIQNGKYVASKIELKNAEGTGLVEGKVNANLENGKITVTVPNKKIEGNYEIELVKQDGGSGEKLSGAVFNVNGQDKTATNATGIVNLGTFTITNTETPDTYVIKETTGPNGYNKFDGSIELSVAKKLENGNYIVDTENTTMVVKDSTGATITQNVPVTIDKTTGKITITVDNVKKEFDLALRKYITKVNGETLTGSNTRIPNIDTTTLENGTTATYKHRKDPVKVETGNIVTYEITIYNEGEKEGRATKIVDQLPEGLKFSEVVSGNFELESYDEETNTVNLIRKEGNTDNLAKYTGGELDSETIEITCEVVEQPGEREKVLTNVAWIAEEYDAESNVTITNQKGLDRDSEPETTPSANQNNMEDYTGNNNQTDLSDSNYYYKGQQDDDDFEKLILNKATGNYEIELVKQDGGSGEKLSGAVFNVNGQDKTATNATGIVNLGTFTITNTETPDTYVIKETTGPNGYNKFEGSIELSVAKKIENGNYVVDTENTTMVVKDSTGATITQNVPVTIDKTAGKITITVDNEKIAGGYGLEILKVDQENTGKVLEGAEFKVTLADGTERTERTNAEGKIEIEGIEITEEGIDKIKIEEIEAPEGYNKIFNSVELEVTKEIQNGKYVASKIELKNAEGTGLVEGKVNANLENGKITVTVPNKKIEGNYEIELVKQDGGSGEKLSGAVFNVNGQDKTATNATGIVNLGTFTITNTETPDTYVIKETTGPNGYNKFEGSIELSVAKKIENGNYVVDTENTTMVVKDSTGATITQNVPVTIDKTTQKITITVDNEKTEGNYVVEIVKKEQGTETALPGAVFNVNGEDKEATNSNGILSLGTVEITDTETLDTYTITETSSPEGYNKFEGSIELSVAKKLENGNYVVDTENTTMVVKDSTGATITENVPVTIEKTTGRITIEVDNEKIVGDYGLEIVKVDSKTGEKLSGAVFNVNGEDKTVTNTNGVLNLGTIQITGTATKDSYIIKETTSPDTYNKFDGTIELDVAKKLENGKYVIDTANTTMTVKDSAGAEITQNIPVTIDKTTGKITITVENMKKEFDLALRKFIIAVSNDQTIEEDEYLRNEDGSYSRAPVVDASQLNTVGTDGNRITTAIYNHTKEPVEVRKGDTVIYTIRVYNEGETSGYAQTITDYLPDELEFLPDHEINQEYEWTIEGNRVTTDYLSKEKETEERQNLIEAFDETRVNEEEPLYYKEVQIACKVKDTARSDWKITNLAQITEDADQNGDETDDRDSTPDGGFEEPEGEERPTYKDDETGEYIPGQEDDDDFEKVIIKEFDLALRKFIIAVSNDQTIEEDEYLRNADGSYTREPVVDTSLLNTEDEEGNLITTAIYNHTKEPVLVQKNDIVIYMLRAYNEGDIDGYAAEIKDHLPPYLEYVDGEFNEKYGWEVSEDGRTVTTRYLENSLINKPVVNEDGKYELSYQEVPVMCRVIESAPTNENITNIADITEYQDDNHEETTDRDSESDNVNLPSDEELPGYKDDETGEYIPGQEDDDDFEKVIVKEFDLALRKWVTEAIVIENGKETVTATGHQPYDDPEEIVKVELHRKKLNQVTVKFRYSIRVTNEGDIPGYVKEITDYIPEGLRFDPADNPGLTDEGNNIISTRLPQDILLQPGEYTEVEVVLTWINDQNNMGVMTNIAEISEDDNEYDIPDRDSTPDNQKEGEDDIDDAPVMISISTGAARTYFMLGGIVLVTLAGGVFLIKKFVI